MKITFNMHLNQGSMDAEVTYAKEELMHESFLLNRDFIVNEILCDGKKLDIDRVMSIIKLEDEYKIKSYLLPKINETVSIKYTGYLSGNNRTWPYVIEKISEEFTLLRHETYYIPIFSDSNNQNIRDFLFSSHDCYVAIKVPKDYTVLSPANLTSVDCNKELKTYFFDCSRDMFLSTTNFAIAKYSKKELPSGIFYVMNTTDDDIDHLKSIIDKTYDYMSKTFGNVNISSTTKYVEIPNGYGSFAANSCLYCVESSLKDRNNMRMFIHEYIHLGWNAKDVEGLDQRIRFFDEAFTNYFTLRVAENIISKDYGRSVFNRYIENYQKQIKNDNKKLVPICDFGKYEYGGLSYTIGALVLYELCKEVGQQIFDKATTEFLNKYRNQPVTLAKFCEEYIILCNRPDLREFFDKWIYSTECYSKYL